MQFGRVGIQKSAKMFFSSSFFNVGDNILKVLVKQACDDADDMQQSIDVNKVGIVDSWHTFFGTGLQHDIMQINEIR